jgi:DNA uptake protein ComE-like DNA-binding protein
MNHSITRTMLIAAALLLSASVSFAVENKAATPGAENATSAPKTTAKKAKPKAAKAVKPVDINSAGKAELKTLPGIDDATAGKIIAGRPYLSKANLVTHKVISLGIYQRLRKLIIARQK